MDWEELVTGKSKCSSQQPHTDSRKSSTGHLGWQWTMPGPNQGNTQLGFRRINCCCGKDLKSSAVQPKFGRNLPGFVPETDICRLSFRNTQNCSWDSTSDTLLAYATSSLTFNPRQAHPCNLHSLMRTWNFSSSTQIILTHSFQAPLTYLTPFLSLHIPQSPYGT